MDFNVGDNVQLKSGGPIMVIDSVEDDSIECIWFNKDGIIERYTFQAETLTEA